ncbi:MAG TPA: succinyldiaminopimelate transaminase [Gammaproteobacteria bacterium]|nr:succinyldiaminopimelate transaminase [Gammaproteobacteria bacterium]
MNSDLQRLQPYPFEKLAALKAGVHPVAKPHIALSIGEPQHPAPEFVKQALQTHISGIQRYPLTKGLPALRECIAAWLQRRYALPASSLDPERHILPVNGTREGLFSVAQALVDRAHKPRVLLPNPFYQIYEGAALLAGAEPYYYPLDPERDYQPDFDAVPEHIWAQCQLLYLCTPNNPTGRLLPEPSLRQLLSRADTHGFVIVSDECYSEIYEDEAHPPGGLLQTALASGRSDFHNCLVLNSLSKRSSLPGLRSGFAAGDARLIDAFTRYRTYHGSAMSETVQQASIAAWNDETHVAENRRLYREKFRVVLDILKPALELRQPEAAFFLWLPTPVDDQEFTRELYARQNLTVLPGSYLSRTIDGRNPGSGHVRIALVAETAQCRDAAQRIKEFLETL